MTGPSPPLPQRLTSIATLRPRYDVWLCDIWGVLHNGVAAHARAVEACEQFRKQHGTVVLITNAPRPFASIARQIEHLKIGPAAYDAIVTSGDVTRHLISGLERRRLFHLGPERDRPIFDGLDAVFAPADTAEAIICTGLFDDETESADDYAPLLQAFRARNLPLICANPDVMVERGGQLVPCAGALAALYQRLGGEVLSAGKPFAPIYDLALEKATAARGTSPDKSRVLAIGDGLATDIAGAEAYGIDAVFIASPVHIAAGRALDAGLAAELFGSKAWAPVAMMPHLVW